ncbi:MAG TPA: hypothetical protein VMB72_01710 [Acidimicrobiales bacterium]|nr:hypothetical protein [Acidimicrobiales bacterium]
MQWVRPVDEDGNVFPFGDDTFGAYPLAPIVDVVADRAGADDGFRFLDAAGDADSTDSQSRLGSWPTQFGGPVGGAVGIAPTADDGGYWLVDAAGDVAALGDATLYGAPQDLTGPVAGITATPDGRGYWVYGLDGNVYPFGDAVDSGSTVGQP